MSSVAQFCMAHMIREFRPNMTDSEFYNEGIEKVTGPVALMEATEAYTRYGRRNVTLLAPGLVFAYNWHEVRGIAVRAAYLPSHSLPWP